MWLRRSVRELLRADNQRRARKPNGRRVDARSLCGLCHRSNRLHRRFHPFTHQTRNRYSRHPRLVRKLYLARPGNHRYKARQRRSSLRIFRGSIYAGRKGSESQGKGLVRTRGWKVAFCDGRTAEESHREIRNAEGRPQRTLSLWLRQEVQEMLCGLDWVGSQRFHPS